MSHGIAKTGENAKNRGRSPCESGVLAATRRPSRRGRRSHSAGRTYVPWENRDRPRFFRARAQTWHGPGFAFRLRTPALRAGPGCRAPAQRIVLLGVEPALPNHPFSIEHAPTSIPMHPAFRTSWQRLDERWGIVCRLNLVQLCTRLRARTIPDPRALGIGALRRSRAYRPQASTHS
jgi:hypothetical protein